MTLLDICKIRIRSGFFSVDVECRSRQMPLIRLPTCVLKAADVWFGSAERTVNVNQILASYPDSGMYAELGGEVEGMVSSRYRLADYQMVQEQMSRVEIELNPEYTGGPDSRRYRIK